MPGFRCYFLSWDDYIIYFKIFIYRRLKVGNAGQRKGPEHLPIPLLLAKRGSFPNNVARVDVDIPPLR
jgi:hypothetical protein